MVVQEFDLIVIGSGSGLDVANAVAQDGLRAAEVAAVGIALLALGGGVAFIGLKKAKQASLAPEEALATRRDTGAWARAEARELIDERN